MLSAAQTPAKLFELATGLQLRAWLFAPQSKHCGFADRFVLRRVGRSLKAARDSIFSIDHRFNPVIESPKIDPANLGRQLLLTMSEDNDPPASKRKASPFPEEEEDFKRIKVEEGDVQINGGDAKNRGRSLSPTFSKAFKDRTPDAERHPEGKKADADPDVDTIPPKREPKSETHDRLAPEAKKPVVSAASRPQNFSQEEKKRGKRLFGGLLNTLSQTTSSSHQKKRLEIERRQHAKAQQQRVEDDKRRTEKLERVRRARMIGQIKFDEQVVRFVLGQRVCLC